MRHGNPNVHFDTESCHPKAKQSFKKQGNDLQKKTKKTNSAGI